MWSLLFSLAHSSPQNLKLHTSWMSHLWTTTRSLGSMKWRLSSGWCNRYVFRATYSWYLNYNSGNNLLSWCKCTLSDSLCRVWTIWILLYRVTQSIPALSFSRSWSFCLKHIIFYDLLHIRVMMQVHSVWLTMLSMDYLNLAISSHSIHSCLEPFSKLVILFETHLYELLKALHSLEFPVSNFFSFRSRMLVQLLRFASGALMMKPTTFSSKRNCLLFVGLEDQRLR